MSNNGHKISVIAWSGFVLATAAVFAGAPANAQPAIVNSVQEYVIPFACGRNPARLPLTAGDYATAVQIHNSVDTMAVDMSVAFTPGNGTVGNVAPVPRVTLQRNQAFQVSCLELNAWLRRANVIPSAFFTAVLVLNSPRELNVMATQSNSAIAGVNQNVHSDVRRERVPGRRINLPILNPGDGNQGSGSLNPG